MTDFAPLPVVQATTAYQLLEATIRAIQEEPRRLYMDQWIVVPHRVQSYLEHLNWSRERYVLDVEHDQIRQPLEAPACGTMACAAGWICLLARGLDGIEQLDIEEEALELITGPPVRRDGWVVRELEEDDGEFSPDERDRIRRRHELSGIFLTFPDTLIDAQPQTPEYIGLIVQRLRTFMQAHDAFLRARTL